MNDTLSYTALLALRTCGTLLPAPAWRLTVAICPGRASDWPTHAWPKTVDIPTPPERAEALEELGFALAPGDDWRWTEAGCGLHGDGRTHVKLLATVPVRPFGGGLG